MKTFLLALLFAALPTGALAALPPTAAERAYYSQDNKLKNPGFELGTVGWTASGGTFTVNTSGAHLDGGTRTGSWDSSAAAQTLTSEVLTVTSGSGFSGAPMTVSCRFQADSGTATHKIQLYDGSTVLAEDTITSVTTGFVRASVTAPAPSSGSVYLRVISVASNEPKIYISKCYRGLAEGFNTYKRNEAVFFGSITYPATSNCQWDVSETTYVADYAADTDCGTPTVRGNVTAPGTKVPFAVLANAPPGDYFVVGRGNFYKANTTNDTAWMRFHDGTNDGGEQSISYVGSGAQGMAGTVTGSFHYTSGQSNLTIKIQARQSSASTPVSVRAIEIAYTMEIYYYPSSALTSMDVTTLSQAWAGYHDSTCSWSRTNTAYGDPTADSTCTLTETVNRNFGTVTSYLSGSDKLPGIVFTPKRAALYYVCARPTGGPSSSTNFMDARLWDGTTVVAEDQFRSAGSNQFRTGNLCGLYNAASTAAVTLRIQTAADGGNAVIDPTGTAIKARAVEWVIFPIDQAFPAVTLSYPRSELIFLGHAGYGSSLTKVPYFTAVTTTNQGDLTYTNTTAGTTVTIGSPGLYALSATWSNASGSSEGIGWTVDYSTNTVLSSIPVANRLPGWSYFGGTGVHVGNAVVTKYLTTGQVLRLSTEGATTPADVSYCQAIVTKVSN